MKRAVQRVGARKARIGGLTLVELLVAMAISLFIVLAAVAAFTATRRSASTVDAASQLRDDARFATDLLRRLVVQTGFEDVTYASAAYRGTAALYKTMNGASGGGGIDINTLMPGVYGYDNAIPSASDPLNTVTTRSSGSVGYGSDVLILQYQPTRVTDTTTDGSMITCDGVAPTMPAADRSDRAVSILYVDVSSGEPTLMCMRRNDAAGTFISPTPLLKGVEDFQVLYGVDNVTPNTAPTGHITSVPNRYLTAAQLTVSGNSTATLANWRRVRSIRVGMVMRGPAGSAQESSTQTLYPLGGSNFAAAGDPGSTFTATDNRLRQVVTFTVQLRNCQNQGYQPDSSTTPCDVVMPS